MKKLITLAFLFSSVYASAQWHRTYDWKEFNRLRFSGRQGGTSADSLGVYTKVQTDSAIAAAGGGLSGLTTNRLLKATGSSSAGNSSITDNGTTVSTAENIGITNAVLFGGVLQNDAPFVAGVNSGGHFPVFTLYNSSSTSNTKVWNNYVDDGGVFHFRLVNDALSAASDWMTITRTAHTAATYTWPLMASGITTPIPSGTEHVMTIDANGLLGHRTIPSAGTAQILFSGTADKTVANTTSTTSLVPTSGRGSMTVAANTLIVGSRIEFDADGVASATSTGSPGWTISFGAGGTTSQIVINSSSGITTNTPLTFHFIGTVRTTGSSGTMNLAGFYQLGNGGFLVATPATAVTINTTTTQTFDMTWAWTSASASNTVTVQNAALKQF